jgi:hypothetical protein
MRGGAIISWSLRNRNAWGEPSSHGALGLPAIQTCGTMCCLTARARRQDNIPLGALHEGDNLALLDLGHAAVIETRL